MNTKLTRPINHPWLLVTYLQAARALSISRRSLTRLLASGEFVPVDVPYGGKRITVRSLERYVRKLRRQAQQVAHA